MPTHCIVNLPRAGHDYSSGGTNPPTQEDHHGWGHWGHGWGHGWGYGFYDPGYVNYDPSCYLVKKIHRSGAVRYVRVCS